MMSMNSGAPFTASEKYSQVSALLPMASYRKWERERRKDKEKENKRKKRSAFDVLLESEKHAYPNEAGFYFEARA